MAAIECVRCGATMERGGVCPVCEIPDEPAVAARASVRANALVDASAEPAAATPVARLWQSGRLAVGLAALCFAVAMLVPLVYVHVPSRGVASVAVSPLDMISSAGLYGRLLRSTVLVALPMAAAGLASFLWSRRTRAAMLASRPLVFVVGLIPAFAAAMPFAKLARHPDVVYGAGPAVALVALGALAGMFGAARFGRGVPAADPHAAADDEDDGD